MIPIVGRYGDPHRWPQACHEIDYFKHTRWILKDIRRRAHNLTWFGPNLTYVHGERTWESFINRLHTKRYNFSFDATRVFTLHLNLTLNYKSFTFFLCTFNLLLSFLASSGLLCLRFSVVKTLWDFFYWGNYNALLQLLFIRFYNIVPIPIWTMRWS